MSRLVTAAAVLALCHCAPTEASEPVEPDVFVGCYSEGAREVLATWNPAGGLALADLTEGTVNRFRASDPDVWTTDPAPDGRAVRLVPRIAGGEAQQIELVKSDERGTTLHRTDCGYSQEEIQFRSGDVELAGLLLLPDGAQGRPGAVFIHGSGDSDRVGTSYLRAADHLASRGIAVLIPDKRGVGKSEGDWRTASIQELADDAVAALEVLGSREGVAENGVGLVAVSQGSWVAPLAAERSSFVRWIVTLSGAAVPFAEQQRYVLEGTAIQLGLTEEQTEQLLEVVEVGHRYTLTSEGWSRYLELRKAGLQTPWAPIASQLPATQHSWEWQWGRSFLAFDPLASWAGLEIPVLMIFGEEDTSVPVDASVHALQKVIESGRDRVFEIRTFPGMGHGLRDSTAAGPAENVLWTMSTWIVEQTVDRRHARVLAPGRHLERRVRSEPRE